MTSLPQIWITATLTLLALTACSSSTPPTAENSSPASPDTVASSAAPKPSSEIKDSSSAMADPKATFANMKAIVAKTTAAVNAGDFAKAQAEFKDFDDGNWMKVEDNVKAKSADTYKQVEDNLDSVNNGLKVAKPNKTKVLVALQSLAKTLDSYTSKY